MAFTLPDPGAPNLGFERPADRAHLERTADALRARGFKAQVADSAEHARQLALGAIPEGSEVHTALSETIRELGITTEIEESGRYESIRSQLSGLDRETQGREMRKLGAAPDYIVGSAHAITDDGEVIVGSGSAASSARTPTPAATSSSSSVTKNSSATSTKASAAYANTACPENTSACRTPATPEACSRRP